MFKILYKNFLVFLVVFVAIDSFSQFYKLTEKSKASILTCGSGNELYSIYGHTAIRFKDIDNNLDVVFNYGNFDFGTDNFYLKFVRGDLRYFVGACTFQEFMFEYKVSNRQVWEQNLKLSLDQKQNLFEEINKAIYSDEKFYTYKFIDKNCTTMVLDKINEIYKKPIVLKKDNTYISYRKILYSFLQENHFWENFGINIIFGQKVDNCATKLFLPEELMQNLASTKFNNKAIAEKAIILNKKINTKIAFSIWNSIYPFILFLLLVVLINNKNINVIYFLLLSLVGLFFATVWIYSQHLEIYWNYNCLLFNPSLLFLIYFQIKNKTSWLIKICYFNIFCLLVYILILLNKVHLPMMLPMIVTSIIIIFRILKSNKTLLTAIK